MAYETRVDLYVCQTTWMATMMLVAMPRRCSSIAGRMIGMTRDALCVNVNSLVSALAQRSTCDRPLFLSVIHLDHVIVTSANHGWNAWQSCISHVRQWCAAARSYKAHVIHIWEVNYWQVTHMWLSWDSVDDVMFESGLSPEPALIPYTSDNLYKVNIS